jgi:hypothetical protein
LSVETALIGPVGGGTGGGIKSPEIRTREIIGPIRKVSNPSRVPAG